MSTLEERSNNLSPVNYQGLFEVIAKHLTRLFPTEHYLLSFYERLYTFDIDKVAWNVAEQLASSKAYPFEHRDGTTCASTYLPSEADKKAFTDQLLKLVNTLDACIQKKWQAQVSSNAPDKPTTIGQYISHLLNPLNAFSRAEGGLHYPLSQGRTFEKQPLRLQPRQMGKPPWLKGHKATIQVENIKTLLPQVMGSIDSYLEQEGCTQEERNEAQANLKAMERQEDSPLLHLEKLVSKESLARIQREARIDYLDYLYQQIKTSPGKKWEGQERTALLSLYTLIQRLKQLETYMRDENLEDAHYQVTFRHTTFNLRTLFARADAFDMLPIISEIEGFLGETTDKLRGTKVFLSGIKLKLNGKVYVHGGVGQSVYEYYLPLLNPEGEAFRAREAQAKNRIFFYEKVLKVATLYFFVFRDMSSYQVHPGESFEKEVLNRLQSGEVAEENAVLYAIYQSLKAATIKQNLDTLRNILEKFLDRTDIGTVPVSYPHALSLKDTILIKDVSSMLDHRRFFRADFEENRGRDITKYLTVENAAASPGAICKLPVMITFEPIYYYAAEQGPEQWTMKYETDGLYLLPVLLAPLDDPNMRAYTKKLKDVARIELGYRHHDDIRPDSEQAFVYRFTYLVLSYLFLLLLGKQITDIEHRSIFFSLICVHVRQSTQEQAEQDTETFMHSLSKLLAHMLAQDYLANSQGLHVNTILQSTDADTNKLKAALFSLYSGLPRSFQFNNQSARLSTQALASSLGTVLSSSWQLLDKLAIIVVSSRHCDVNMQTPDEYFTTVYGELIGLEQLDSGAIRVSTLSTFSLNQHARFVHKHPEAIIEQVKHGYTRGYRHFLYVAQAPYSSTLHISDKENLYFMNEGIIEALRSIAKDIKIYPTFCDKYYVVNQERKKKKRQHVDSLYIDDIGQLAVLSNDPSRRSLIFLNLFSGATVRPDSIYNGVMSYATLRNVYADPAYDQEIWSGLLNTATPPSLRNDILGGIALLHFARYEKPRDLGFKLDPYKRVIGDTSVGKLSLLPHMKNRVQFNALAFLTLVRAVMRAQISGGI